MGEHEEYRDDDGLRYRRGVRMKGYCMETYVECLSEPRRCGLCGDVYIEPRPHECFKS